METNVEFGNFIHKKVLLLEGSTGCPPPQKKASISSLLKIIMHVRCIDIQSRVN